MSISIKDKTFIICSIVRNAEKGLKMNIPVVNAFCKEVHDFQIVVFENNSTDGTKALLADWIKQDATRIASWRTKMLLPPFPNHQPSM